MSDHGERLWGEGFGRLPSEEALAFMAGRDVHGLPPCDELLIPYDIRVNEAHATMLRDAGIIPKESADRILDGLAQARADYRAGKFRLDPSLEDVHTNVERYLAERIGEVHAGHLHTGRSRNDQVLCDMRLYERDAAVAVVKGASCLARSMISLAETHVKTIMPGFTHHQHATITTFGHVLLGFVPGVIRTAERAIEWHGRFDRCPLGCVAAYGTTFPIQPDRAAQLLGFSGPEDSTLDPVQTRGEPEAELAGILELALWHLATLGNSLILLATEEFRCVRIADEYSSGSSIMPQKRNPDVLEVLKARAAAVSGTAQALRSLLGRSLFGYNREQQWAKYLVMDAIREALPCFGMVRGVLETLSVDIQRMRQLAERGYLLATPLVEALCREYGLPFREAKGIVATAVAEAAPVQQKVLDVDTLTRAGLEVAVTEEQVRSWQDPEATLERLTHAGAPGPDAVRDAAAALLRRLDSLKVLSPSADFRTA